MVGDAPPFAAEFGPTGALRQDFGETGRVHVDRPLPFIVLHRADPDSGTSLARDVALTSPAYAVWTGPADDAAAAAALDAIIAEQGRRFGRILAIAVDDLPRPGPAADDSPGAAAVPDRDRRRRRRARRRRRRRWPRRCAGSRWTCGRATSTCSRNRVCRRAWLISRSIMPASPFCRSACRATTKSRAAAVFIRSCSTTWRWRRSTRCSRRPARSWPRPGSRRRTIIAGSAAAPSSTRQRRPTRSSTGSAATSISCSACRRSTPTRRSSSSDTTSGSSRPPSATGRSPSTRARPRGSSTGSI